MTDILHTRIREGQAGVKHITLTVGVRVLSLRMLRQKLCKLLSQDDRRLGSSLCLMMMLQYT